MSEEHPSMGRPRFAPLRPRRDKTDSGAQIKSQERRSLLKTLGIISVAPVASAPQLAVAADQEPKTGLRGEYVFFTSEESAFVEAAVARLIPGSAEDPGAIEADVPNYIDKMLASGWGSGQRLYRQGPWHEGEPQQGYQLPFTPAELFRNAVGALNRQDTASGLPFWKRSTEEQDKYLTDLEKSEEDLDGVPGSEFFSQLLNWTTEGFFADPVYGGNRDMVSWKLLGFPGAYANYYQLVDQHGTEVDRDPVSLAQTSSGKVKINPNIPPYAV